MSTGAYTNALTVTIDERPLQPDTASALIEAWVDASVNVPAAFHLMFRDSKRMVLGKLGVKIGSKVVLRAFAAGKDGDSPLLTGEVTGLEIDYDGTGKFSVVRGHDPGHRLLRHRRVAGYTNMTAAQIAVELAEKDGLDVGEVTATATSYPMITQPNVTDWEFLTRLAQENDREISFSDEGRFQFVAPRLAAGAPGASATARQSHHVLEFGTNLLRCRAGVTSADQVSQVRVRGWSVATKQALLAQSPSTTSSTLEIGVTGEQVEAAFGQATLTETDVPYDTNPEATGAAAALAADVGAAFAEVEAVVMGDPKLKPGLAVALNGVGLPFEGKYTVTTVRHTFLPDTGYQTWVSVTGRQHRSLFGLASGGVARTPRMPGVVNAIVTDIKDPANQGMVKLTFPWLSDSYVSDWCRVVQFGGVRGGGVIMPDVNDEVLVAFDRGSLDHPYVLGGLYNGMDRLPTYYEPAALVDGVSGQVGWRSLASRSGNRVQVLDSPSAKGVKIATGDDALRIELAQTGTTINVTSAGEVTIKAGTAVSVEAGGDLSFSAGGAVSIRAGGAVNLTAAGEVGIEAAGAVNLIAAGEVGIEAGGVATVDAGGDVTIAAIGNLSATAVNVVLAGVVTANGLPVV